MIDPISRMLHSGAGKHGPVMLMYHSVAQGKSTPSWPWAVSMAAFRAHLDFLAAEGYATPTVRELAEGRGAATAERTAVITFDDGYADNLHACEELYRRGMRASWFVVSGSLGKAPGWQENGRPAGRLLTEHELRQLRTANMEIGSHSVNHIRLTTVDDNRLTAELACSKADLENAVGTKVSSFAYPYGDWDERCEAFVKHAGYAAACTTRTGWTLRDQSPYRLRRLTVFNTDSPSTLARKLALGTHDVGWSDLSGYWRRQLIGRLHH